MRGLEEGLNAHNQQNSQNRMGSMFLVWGMIALSALANNIANPDTESKDVINIGLFGASIVQATCSISCCYSSFFNREGASNNDRNINNRTQQRDIEDNPRNPGNPEDPRNVGYFPLGS